LPRYDYKCRDCGYQEQVTHSIKIKLTDCNTCGNKDTLYRLITSFSTIGLNSDSKEAPNKPGSIVNEFIENTKREVGEYKADITKNVSNIEDVGE
tara:strand:+ start:195 stop:479 length:285 start_codon:yes stop_codon:yes gene_type:complete